MWVFSPDFCIVQLPRCPSCPSHYTAAHLVNFIPSYACYAHAVVCVFMCRKMLDIIETMCKSAGYLLLRLDGQTPTARRMEIVERFNSRSSPECE